MRRRNKAFAPSLVEFLEVRLTLSGQGIHPVALIGHHHMALVDAHHTALTTHHHSALVHTHPTALTGHHHGARLRHHHAASGAPTAGSTSTGAASGATTTGTDPATTGTDPATTGTDPATTGSDPTSGNPGPTSGNPGPTSGGGSGSTSVPIVLSGKVAGAAAFDGSGTVGSLGAVTTTGKLTTSGAEPVVYTGEITIVGATGSVTVDLSGLLFGPSSLDETIKLTYTIASGTGAFQGATGSGKAVLTTVVSSTGGSFALTFGDATSTSA